MSMVRQEDVKRGAARRKSALILEIIKGNTTIAEAAMSYDLTPSGIEEWVDQVKAGMESALRAKPEDIREQYERQLKDLQEAYGEAMLELRRGLAGIKEHKSTIAGRFLSIQDTLEVKHT